MQPTPEQEEALRLFATGESLAIEAGAGTGKTSTLVLLAESAPNRRGQYVAFNKALVEDGKAKFPPSVAANTAHSLAYRAMLTISPDFAKRLRQSQRMSGREVAQRLAMSELYVTDFMGQPKILQPGFLGSLAVKAVTNFCQSADSQVEPKHVPKVEGLDGMTENGRHTFDKNRHVAETVAPYAQRIWADVVSRFGGWVPYKHEYYLKHWQLLNPRIDTDYILFDEAQDANPVIAAIVAAQADHAQLVYVGDSQQEIYAWTGAVNALGTVRVAHRSYLTQSFRFGQAIADEANTVLEKLTDMRLTGNPAIESSVGALVAPKAILVRTNATGITNLIRLQAEGHPTHLIGGSADLSGFARAVQELQEAGHTAFPELAMFGSWDEVRTYVANDAMGEDLGLMVRLVDTFGAATIIDALAHTVEEDKAEIVISTAHKAKGRQWKSVQLAPDFAGKSMESKEGLRLLYVAITRAQEQLDIDAIRETADIGGTTCEPQN